MYRESDLSEEKVRILCALGTMQNEELLKKFLDFSLTDEVKAQDLLSILLNVATSKIGMTNAWTFFQTNIDVFKRKYVSAIVIFTLIKILFRSISETNLIFLFQRLVK